MEFSQNIEDLVCLLQARKDSVKRYLKTHFKENVHFIVTKSRTYTVGRNKEDILLTKETFDLIQSTYNLKNRYITKVKDTTIVNPIIMSLENSTIGFIVECLGDITQKKRQFKVGHYFVDLYLPDCNIVVECDENGHNNYNCENEILREKYISEILGCTFIRFNPNQNNFSLSSIVYKIFKLVFLHLKGVDL
ncbi:DUF559 domain-containing protein [bacterium]|nr:DUF559 domain-containing protein [bacterium]